MVSKSPPSSNTHPYTHLPYLFPCAHSTLLSMTSCLAAAIQIRKLRHSEGEGLTKSRSRVVAGTPGSRL